MSELLIFGGTTEARELAEFCFHEEIPAEVSVTTDYGASLLPDVRIHIGCLNGEEMQTLLRKHPFRLVIDATHPYAVEATHNIRTACEATGIPYLRLIRQSENVPYGDSVPDLQALISYLNQSEGKILSTLGSKSLPALTQVRDFVHRMYIRVLPAEGILRNCTHLGFPATHIIMEKGPFTVTQNVQHIHQSSAKLLVTKESGSTGGYPEKAEAAKLCSIRMVTLLRPPEDGCTLTEIMELLKRR